MSFFAILRSSLLVACLGTVLATQPAFAASAASQKAAKPAKQEQKAATGDEVGALFAKRTGLTPSSVRPAPIAGFYEIAVGTAIYYMEPTGAWLFDGHLVDLDSKKSVTMARKAELEAEASPKLNLDALNFADGIQLTVGNTPRRTLVIFADPNCAYCKKLEPELSRLQNINIFIMPVSYLGDASVAKNKDIWCSRSKVAAWSAAMASQPVPAAADCDAGAVQRNGELARRLKVEGTPTIFLPNGARIPGYTSAEDIERRLTAAIR